MLLKFSVFYAQQTEKTGEFSALGGTHGRPSPLDICYVSTVFFGWRYSRILLIAVSGLDES